MEYTLNTIVDSLIRAIHQYNSMLQYRPAQDPQCLTVKGGVEALMLLLKELGYPLTVSMGRVWHVSGMHHERGYGCIMFSKNKEELESIGVFRKNHFENGIYWFIEGNAELTKYRGRCE